VNGIKITPAVPVPGNVAGGLKLRYYFLDSPLGKAYFTGYYFRGAFGMIGNKDKYPAVVREKSPLSFLHLSPLFVNLH